MKNLDLIFQQNETHWKETYKKFLRFESISTDPKYVSQVQECFAWIKKYVEKTLGFETKTWETPDHPTLFAQRIIDPQKPTVLLYGHYDVQPIDPLEDWITPPFEPSERDGHIYARGACDDKGQIFYALCALEALKDNLPCNIKLCIEGGEEIGSGGLSTILESKKNDLKADYTLVVDGGILGDDSPAISLGVRGIITGELTVKGSKNDLHSGTHGGVVYNPLHAISEILANLRDSEGRVTIPNFYEGIKKLSEEEVNELSWDFFEEKRYEKNTGTKSTGGEKAYSPGMRGTLRPTLEVNGLWGGYTQKGFKTVIPAEAKAKISCRLVPGQNPEKILEELKAYFKQISIPGIKVSFESFEGIGESVFVSPKSQIAQVAKDAYEEVFQTSCKKIMMGGSVPITANLAKYSQSQALIMGVAIETDLVHAPNENFSWKRFKQGYTVVAEIIKRLSLI